MDSSPEERIASPALSPENDEYANALADYDDLVVEAAKRFEAFGEADVAFKDLQENLHELLTLGDSLWEDAAGATKGSRGHVAAVDGLREATGSIRKVIGEQDAVLDTLDRAVGRAARGLARLSEAVGTIRSHAEGVRQVLDERIDEMKAIEPALADRRSSRSAKEPKEPKEPKESSKEPKKRRAEEEAAAHEAKERERALRRREREIKDRGRELKERPPQRARSQERARAASHA
jgi:hypothetical protein